MKSRCCKIPIILFSIIIPIFVFGVIDLEEHTSSFVLGTHRIEIPGHPDAFNPSIIRWRGSLLLSFRIIQNNNPPSENNLHSSSESNIGLVWLDNDFQPDSQPQLLDLHDNKFNKFSISRSEDARLIAIDERLYVIYSDNTSEVLTEGGFRMHIAEIDFDGESFIIQHIECIKDFEGENPCRREKNWIPFNYQGNLLFAYSLLPHRILYPYLYPAQNIGSGVCETIANTRSNVSWDWGELRGGTPAILIDPDHYLAIFHSSMNMTTLHSDGEDILHYFMGAYTFSSKPPFQITQASPEPIVGNGFYHGTVYKPYWKPVRVVFPCGILDEDGYIWVTYGRQDHEIWIMKMDKAGLLASLKPTKVH